MATRLHTNSPLPASTMHATHGLQQSKSHVLAGVQDAYWSDDEAVSICKPFFLSVSSTDTTPLRTGGRRVPPLSRGDGHLRSELQAMPLWLPGACLRSVFGLHNQRTPWMQVCQFCWHHIKENLNRRCPACRREYTDDAVQFKPINPEE